MGSPVGSGAYLRAQEKSREKARRASRLWDRGHSLQSIGEIIGIKAGAVQQKIDLGRRLRDADI